MREAERWRRATPDASSLRESQRVARNNRVERLVQRAERIRREYVPRDEREHRGERALRERVRVSRWRGAERLEILQHVRGEANQRPDHGASRVVPRALLDRYRQGVVGAGEGGVALQLRVAMRRFGPAAGWERGQALHEAADGGRVGSVGKLGIGHAAP